MRPMLVMTHSPPTTDHQFYQCAASEAYNTLKDSSNPRFAFLKTRAEPGSKLLLAYGKPTSINVVGSFVRRTALLLDRKVTIDLAVTMPSHLFQAKDYRDYRYFQKRAYYLACLADGLHKARLPHLAISFTLQDDNPLQPILILEPTQDEQGDKSAQSNYRIRILLAASSDLFPVEKTLPTKGCIRHFVAGGQEGPPSPTYNAVLRSECCSLISLKLLEQSIGQSDAFRGACMLGAVWLRQRGIGSSTRKGGFGQFEWASVISMLMRGGGRTGRPLLSAGYSSYQLFKATLQFLATTDLITAPIMLSGTNFKLGHADYPVFFDGFRGLNLLFKMSSWSYRMLRHEAKNSLKALNDPLVDHFKALFITQVDESFAKFDYVFRVRLSQHHGVPVGTGIRLDETNDLIGKLYKKLAYGLSDRATLICPDILSGNSWQLLSSPSPSHSPFYLAIGLLLNPQNSRRTVDRGPPVEEKEASAVFREFWGEKAELRRFKDGTILESVVWTDPNPKQVLLDVIVGHILQRHFGIQNAGGSGMFAKAFDNVLPQQIGTQEGATAPFSAARSTFEALCKSIRDLQELPLQIRHLSAAAPELRFCSVHAPVVGKPRTPNWPVNFQVQFEGSTRWPQDLIAVQRTKIAFLLKIAEGLEGDSSISAVAVGLEGKKQRLPEDPFLDIATTGKVVFRLRVYHEHEIKLLENALHSATTLFGSREELALALSSHKRTYIQGPAHTQAVYALITRFPLLPHTVRLMKKWRDAHLLSSHVPDELIELLVIRTFVHPSPWQAPGSLNSAFIRTLASIASWNWHSEPLIVDCDSELNKDDIEAIHADFEAWRNIDPRMNRVAIFAASNIDRGCITWTDHRPAKVIASRFTKLAGAAVETIRDKGLSLEPEILFVPSLHEYDFVVYLKDEFAMGTVEKSSFKNLQVEALRDPLDAISNPAQEFFDELEELHGDNIIFFHNRSMMTIIAGVWKPHTGPRGWKVGLDYDAWPVFEDESTEPQVTINKAAVLHGIARLGGNMISKIDQRS
ncbi:MAG: hypothetical protein Q9207_001085 [Kuettlingeria erythrocarpa]